MNKGIIIIVEILFVKNNNKIANKKNKIYCYKHFRSKACRAFVKNIFT